MDMELENKTRSEYRKYGERCPDSVNNLTTQYVTREIGVCHAVNNVSFQIKEGETLGLVGETGAGKTTIALSILRLLQSPPARIVSGEILWQGRDILTMSKSEMRKLRGGEISMVFQDPMTALNPILNVGDQIAEVIFRIRRQAGGSTS